MNKSHLRLALRIICRKLIIIIVGMLVMRKTKTITRLYIKQKTHFFLAVLIFVAKKMQQLAPMIPTPRLKLQVH
jgi:hypothetical protein